MFPFEFRRRDEGEVGARFPTSAFADVRFTLELVPFANGTNACLVSLQPESS